MKKQIRKLSKRGKATAQKLLRKVEKEVMAAVGRRAVRAKVREVGEVGRRMAKAGLVAGTSAAAGALLRETRPRRKPVAVRPVA